MTNRLASSNRVKADEAPAAPAWALAALVYFVIGRVGDLVPVMQNVPAGELLTGVAILSLGIAWRQFERSAGRPIRHSQHNQIVRRVSLFILVAIASISWSAWRSHSADFVMGTLLVTAAIFWLCFLSARSTKQINIIIGSIAAAAATLAVLAISSETSGRVTVKSSYDPNDLALVLVVSSPLVLLRVLSGTPLRRVIWASLLVIILLAIFATQSRGGIVALISVAALFVVRGHERLAHKFVSREKNRTPIGRLFIVILAAALLWIAAPHDARERIGTLAAVTQDYNIALDEGRLGIWKRGLRALATRPVGYGIDCFAIAEGSQGGRWRASHNQYIQVAVELGPVGIVLYLAMFASAVRILVAQSAPNGNASTKDYLERTAQSEAILWALVAALVGGMFLSTGYSVTTFTLLGLAGAVERLSAGRLPRGRRTARSSIRMRRHVIPREYPRTSTDRVTDTSIVTSEQT